MCNAQYSFKTTRLKTFESHLVCSVTGQCKFLCCNARKKSVGHDATGDIINLVVYSSKALKAWSRMLVEKSVTYGACPIRNEWDMFVTC